MQFSIIEMGEIPLQNGRCNKKQNFAEKNSKNSVERQKYRSRGFPSLYCSGCWLEFGSDKLVEGYTAQAQLFPMDLLANLWE